MVALLGQAMPSFWLGLMLMITFGLQLGWLPISGTGSWQHYVMPGIVLAFSAIPALTRLTRAGMIQAMGSDYIRTARAKGLSRASILLKHALRNAAIPVVAIAAVQLGFMLGGSIVIEQVFALHGVGFLAWESIGKNDFPVVQAVVLVLAVIYVGAHHAGRPDERRARSEAARPMSVAHRVDVPAATARLEERQHLDRRGDRRHRRDLRRLAPLLVPHDPFAQDLGKRLLVPFWMEGTDPGYILGTDQLGRDYLSRLIWGCRISMLIGVTVTIVSGLIGITHRRAGRLPGRPGRRCRAVRHHHAAVDPGRAGGAGRGRAARQLDDLLVAHARPAAVGPLRRGGALDHHAGAQSRLRRRRLVRRLLALSHPAAARCCPTSRATSSSWRRSRSRSPSCSRPRSRSSAWACRRRCRRGA